MSSGNNDKPPFETLFREHYRRLFTLAMRMAGQREQAEEILQEAFLNAFQQYSRFRGESSAYTWLYRIVLNEGRKQWRKARQLPVERYAAENDLSQAEVYRFINRFGPSEEEALIRQVRESCLQIFMNCMPSRYRSVFTLRQILHFDVSDTAKILEVSKNTVKVNLSRARKVIAGHLQGRCSLVCPNGLCDCRLYAEYIHRSGKRDKLIDMEVIRKREISAKEEMQKELREIYPPGELYDGEIRPPNQRIFFNRVHSLCRERKLKILSY